MYLLGTLLGLNLTSFSFLQGYRQRLAYIATQGPLEETIDDFWRMLMEHNSNIVVMLTQLYEGDRVSVIIKIKQLIVLYVASQRSLSFLHLNYVCCR